MIYDSNAPVREPATKPRDATALGAPNLPPVVQHLFTLLPPPGAHFPAKARHEFLIATRSILTLLYGGTEYVPVPPDDEQRRRLEIVP